MTLTNLIGIGVTLVTVAFVAWLFGGSGKTSTIETPDPDRIIDPNDPQEVGRLIGLTGGDIPDAVVAQYALTRFAEEHGRPATFRETATLVGLIKTIG